MRLAHRMYSFLSSQNIMYENQYGFRKSHSTTHVLDYIESCVKDKKHIVRIFIELSKAFDTISHDKLLHKLNNHGF